MNRTKHLRAIAYVIFGLLSVTQFAWAVGSIEPKDAAARVKAGTAVIIDVREAEEVKDGKAEPAIWLATSEIKSQNEHYQKVLTTLTRKRTSLSIALSVAEPGSLLKCLTPKASKHGIWAVTAPGRMQAYL